MEVVIVMVTVANSTVEMEGVLEVEVRTVEVMLMRMRKNYVKLKNPI